MVALLKVALVNFTLNEYMMMVHSGVFYIFERRRGPKRRGARGNLTPSTGLQSVTTVWPVPKYTAWRQRHMNVNPENHAKRSCPPRGTAPNAKYQVALNAFGQWTSKVKLNIFGNDM